MARARVAPHILVPSHRWSVLEPTHLDEHRHVAVARARCISRWMVRSPTTPRVSNRNPAMLPDRPPPGNAHHSSKPAMPTPINPTRTYRRQGRARPHSPPVRPRSRHEARPANNDAPRRSVTRGDVAPPPSVPDDTVTMPVM